MLSYAVPFLTALALLMGTLSASAATVVVGSCRPKLQTYSTISQAVSSVPSGSTILICPGTYPEQVKITQPLTLRGVISGDSDRAIITVPAAVPGAGFRLQVSLTSQATRVYLGGYFPFAAQVLVQSPNVFI